MHGQPHIRFPIPDSSSISTFSWECSIYNLIVIVHKIERWYLYDLGTKDTGWYFDPVVRETRKNLRTT